MTDSPDNVCCVADSYHGLRFFSDLEEEVTKKAEESWLRRLSKTLEPAEKTEFVHVPVHTWSEVAGKELSVLHLRKRFNVSIRRESGEVIFTPD